MVIFGNIVKTATLLNILWSLNITLFIIILFLTFSALQTKNRYLCKQCRSRWDGSLWTVSQGLYCCHSVFVFFLLAPPFAAVDMSKFKAGRGHFRNLGVKELIQKVPKCLFPYDFYILLLILTESMDTADIMTKKRRPGLDCMQVGSSLAYGTLTWTVSSEKCLWACPNCADSHYLAHVQSLVQDPVVQS